MKVIFTKEVPGIAHQGDVKTVADGYALNFLFPSRVALPATPGNVKSVSLRKKSVEIKVIKQARTATDLARQLQGLKVDLKAKADDKGTLFGGIGASRIAHALSRLGFDVQAGQIKLEQPIKSIGNHPVKLQLDAKSAAQILLTVNKE